MSQLNDTDKIQTILKNFLQEQVSSNAKGREKLKDSLKIANFDLVETFNCGGTQAFLAMRDKDKIAVLAFRGTQATEWSDIKADLYAILKRSTGFKIHSGFLKAFENVEQPIKEEVDRLNDYALYITGHSLGGALALIATRKLERDNIAACYTFGSPRVGSSEFADPIKTPIYRIVNTADVVPRMPPGIIIELAVDLLRFLRELFPFLEYIAGWLDNKVSGYRHHGDMRYLTNCEKEDYSDVRLIANLNGLARWRRLIKNRLSLNRHIEDHAIDEYCKKLAAYAQKR